MDNYIDPTNAPPGPSPYSNARGLLGGMGMTAAANAWNSWPSLAPNDVPATLPSNYDVTVPKCELWPGVLSLANVDLSFEWVPGPPPDATARLFAELVIGSGDNPTTLDVSGSLAVSDTAVTLSLDVEFAAGSSLGGLVEQIFSAMGVGQLVPEDLLNRAVVAPRGQLTLDFRALAAAGGSPPINSLVPTTWVLSHRFELSFAVGGGGTWDVIPGFLTLAAPVALLVGDQGVWTLHLQERLQLFGAAFVLDIAVPSLTGTVILAASLATGPVEAAPAPVAARAGDAPPPVNTTEALAEAAAAKATAAFTLGGLLAHFGLHDTGGLGAVGVTACAVSFDGSQHAASLSLQFVAAKITLGEFSATMQSLEVGYEIGRAHV